jgi:hypothetical protein
MGQHDFLDKSNRTIIHIVATNKHNGKKKISTGMIINCADNVSGKFRDDIYLLGSREVLSTQDADISLEFHEYSDTFWYGGPYRHAKKYCFDIGNEAYRQLPYPHNQSNVASLLISPYVTQKFIKGVKPFFYMEENMLADGYDGDSLLGKDVMFVDLYSSCLCEHSIIMEYPLTAYWPDSEDGRMRFVGEGKPTVVYPNSPIFVRDNGKLRFAGIVTGPPIQQEPLIAGLHSPATIVGCDRIRELITKHRNRYRREEEIPKTNTAS